MKQKKKVKKEGGSVLIELVIRMVVMVGSIMLVLYGLAYLFEPDTTVWIKK